MKKTILCIFALVGALSMNAQNPYLPLWEHLPDGEPHIAATTYACGRLPSRT